jgi:hypothetical protein
MPNFNDCSVGFIAEDTFNTYKAPDRWVEFTKETLNWDKSTKQGKGMRVGSRVARSGRRVTVTGQGKGNLEVEVASKGLGSLLAAAFGGTSTSTLVSTGLYQQVHALGDTLPSLTVQKGLPRVDGTLDAYSFLGCTVDSLEIESSSDDILSTKFGLDIAGYSTAQAYVTPSYVADPVDLYHWGQGVAEIGGTVTAASTTALASMTGEITVSVRNFTCTISNNVNTKRWNYGNSGRKSKQLISGLREIKGKFTAEYDQATLRDAFLNDTDVPMLITFTGPVVGAANAVFQIVIPVARLDGNLPEADGGELITIDHSFTVLDGLSQAPVTLVQRTSDAAL